ncbi:unnamed protein product [Lepidochelys olivacea]
MGRSASDHLCYHSRTYTDTNFLGDELNVTYVEGHKACQQVCTDTLCCQVFTYFPLQESCNKEGLENPNIWRVYADILKLSEINEDTPVFKVQEIIIHPQYVIAETGYDIALMKLDKPMNFTVIYNSPYACHQKKKQTHLYRLPGDRMALHKRTSVLPPGNHYNITPALPQILLISIIKNQVQDILQKATIPLISNEECQTRYQQDRINDKMICAGYREGGKDACKTQVGHYHANMRISDIWWALPAGVKDALAQNNQVFIQKWRNMQTGF